MYIPSRLWQGCANVFFTRIALIQPASLLQMHHCLQVCFAFMGIRLSPQIYLLLTAFKLPIVSVRVLYVA